MNISQSFIRRPVATTLLMLSLVVFGIMAYLRLPVAALPDVDMPTIEVSASLPGASPQTMAASVATPLEREFSGIDGVASMNSQSSLGSTRVTLQFDARRNLDAAAQDVQAAISRATPRLPSAMRSPPSFRKVNPADQSIVVLSVSSRTLPLYVVSEWAETRLAQQISTVPGVAQVQVFGPQAYAVRIQADPSLLAAREVGLLELADAIAQANVNQPTGTLQGASKAFTIETNGQIQHAAGYAAVPVVERNGALVHVRDVATVIDSVENDETAAWRGGPDGIERAVVLGVRKQPGANTVEVAGEVMRLLPRFRESLPAAAELDVVFDRSNSIRESVHDVELTLLLTFALVVMVIFLFLRRLAATLIPTLAMPLSVLGTFAVMYLCGFSLNNLSLMALTLSIGFVVDDAIVALENIVRHVERGLPPLEAALVGMKEIGFTIVSMTVSLAAVFLPFLFLGGIVGGLLREFSVTIAVAILVSGVVSLTLTPMLSARMLRAKEAEDPSPLFRVSERVFARAEALYQRSLERALRLRGFVLVFSALVLVATVALFQHIPKGFLPTEDTDQININTEAAQGSSYEAAKANQQRVSAIVQGHPDVAAFMSMIGGRGSSAEGRVFMRLRPRSDRDKSATEVAAELSQALAAVPGMRSFVQVPPPVRIGGRSSKSEFQLTLESTDDEALFSAAGELVVELEKASAVRDVTSDLMLKNPTLDLDIDRERAALLGLSARDVEDALYSAYGTREVSTIFAESSTHQVILELDPTLQDSPESLSQLQLRAPSGALVPFDAIAEVKRGVGPLTVAHSGQVPAVTVSFDVAEGQALGDAVKQVEETTARVLPSSVTARFQGTAEAFQSSMGDLGLLLAIAIFVIYVVLGILYESFVHPITILSALPFAGFGALVTLLAFGKELDVYAFVGVILLVGLVKKNGIMMIDFAIEARKRPGTTAEHAILQGSVTRFRPIMMTTMAALFGTLPIALGLGAGGEARAPLGLAVVGGLFFSQLLTLYATPVFYLALEGLRERLGSRRPVAP